MLDRMQVGLIRCRAQAAPEFVHPAHAMMEPGEVLRLLQDSHIRLHGAQRMGCSVAIALVCRRHDCVCILHHALLQEQNEGSPDSRHNGRWAAGQMHRVNRL